MKLNKNEQKALEKIVKMYLYEEERHYEEQEQPRGHIYLDFKLLDKKINEKKPIIIKY